MGKKTSSDGHVGSYDIPQWSRSARRHTCAACASTFSIVHFQGWDENDETLPKIRTKNRSQSIVTKASRRTDRHSNWMGTKDPGGLSWFLVRPRCPKTPPGAVTLVHSLAVSLERGRMTRTSAIHWPRQRASAITDASRHAAGFCQRIWLRVCYPYFGQVDRASLL